jgi:hypothetical protein
MALPTFAVIGAMKSGTVSLAFLDHFDRSQVLVIASEVLRDRPREALTAVFRHLAVDPAAADLDNALRASPWPPGTQSLEMVSFRCRDGPSGTHPVTRGDY